MSEQKREGTILKALSGFYYVQCGKELITTRARGKFRYKKITPLVGDRVAITVQEDGSGSLDEILKDADVIDHSLSDPTKEVKVHEVARYAKLCEELGLAD